MAYNQNNNGPKPRKETFGGIWKKKDKNGATYLSLSVEENGVKTAYLAFANKLKQPGENTPDFILNKAGSRGDSRPAIPAARPPAPARVQPRVAVQQAPVQAEDEPF